MKKLFRDSLFILGTSLFLMSFQQSFSQTLLLEENFDYTESTKLTDNGWSAHAYAGTNPITVSSSSLTYSEYTSSGIGKAALVDADGESVNKTFAGVTSGSLYISFLINVNRIGSNDYVFNLGTNPISGTYRGRIFLIDNGSGGFELGISQSSTSPVLQTSNNYSYSNNYLVILKYKFVSGGANDEVSLYIFNTKAPSVEPESPTLGVVTGSTDLSSIGSIALRQQSNSTNFIIDGIRVATDWSLAPLPVELTNFNAIVNGNIVKLNWATSTEVNNYGFEIERASSSTTPRQDWERIGFVKGNGNSNSPNEYSFVDKNIRNGKYSYRLKQIDNDGASKYSKEVEVEINTPAKFLLAQNYPNPFNPATTIEFQLAVDSHVVLKIFDALGREVRTLLNEFRKAGSHSVFFDAGDLSSGIYFYKLAAGNFSEMKKLTVLK